MAMLNAPMLQGVIDFDSWQNEGDDEEPDSDDDDDLDEEEAADLLRTLQRAARTKPGFKAIVRCLAEAGATEEVVLTAVALVGGEHGLPVPGQRVIAAERTGPYSMQFAKSDVGAVLGYKGGLFCALLNLRPGSERPRQIMGEADKFLKYFDFKTLIFQIYRKNFRIFSQISKS